MIDTGAQHTFDEDTPPMSDDELDDMLWTLQNSLGYVEKKRTALDDEEKEICKLIRDVRNEICRREELKEFK
ncbi:MAG: hypothetical protein DRQ46_07675 [Gammaproteobacteria bacterium]|nr:MAG: hypothetical protein DRQ46_07675 [Gammaproteobacteria bacterium]